MEEQVEFCNYDKCKTNMEACRQHLASQFTTIMQTNNDGTLQSTLHLASKTDSNKAV